MTCLAPASPGTARRAPQYPQNIAIQQLALNGLAVAVLHFGSLAKTKTSSSSSNPLRLAALDADIIVGIFYGLCNRNQPLICRPYCRPRSTKMTDDHAGIAKRQVRIYSGSKAVLRDSHASRVRFSTG